MEKCFLKGVIWTLIYLLSVTAADELSEIRHGMRAMSEQIKNLKTLHSLEISALKKEIEELKQKELLPSSVHQSNEQLTLKWAKTSMKELRTEIREMGRSINNSVLLHRLHVIENELKQSLMESNDLGRLARTLETRMDKSEVVIHQFKYSNEQLRTMVADVRKQYHKLSHEMKEPQNQEWLSKLNSVDNAEESRGEHKYRHSKMVHMQISRLAKIQNEMEQYQKTLQGQMLDIQKRLDRLEEPNWDLLSTKLEFSELEIKVLRENFQNLTQKISDFDKVHASVLELREDMEAIENKADKVMPEISKEISKLDINYAQLNAQVSYLKEGQENLRQTTKAIAVSVSNAIDRADSDRLLLKNVNETMLDLESKIKQHFYRLNDHILKSEKNHSNSKPSQDLPLPMLINEVKELQPVEKEYQNLVNRLPQDCSTVNGEPGTYLIHPGYAPFETWCANGSTLLQRRYNGSIEFNRNFSAYVHGFGIAASEYWMGLESMHILTADNCSGMRIDMTDIYGMGWYAQYDHFYVGSADTGYVLEVSGFSGNASDAFEYQNHMEFSAIDHDRDISNTHCAGNYEGGWWFSHCQHVNINGKYSLGLTWFDSGKNEWIAVATSEMRMFTTC